MQRRSLRGRVSDAQIKEAEPAPPTPTTSAEEETSEPELSEHEPEPEVPPVEPPPPKRRPGRPRKSEQKQPEPKPPVLKPFTQNDGDVVLNARGTPMRQRKRNRFYEDDEKPDPVHRAKPEKKIKMEPLQILLDNPSNCLKVTPIISAGLELEEAEVTVDLTAPSQPQPQLPLARKSVVKLILPSPTKFDDPPAEKGPQVEEKQVEPKVPNLTKPNVPIMNPVKVMKTEVPRSDSGIRRIGYNRMDSNRRSDFTSFIRFFANVKTRVILPDRWGINGMMYDPLRKMKTFTLNEMQISNNGDLVIRKCIQVFEDLSLMISVHGRDLTDRIGIRKVLSDQDVPTVVAKVHGVKVCSGVKAFETQDLSFHPMAKKRGSCYFSSECSTVLTFNSTGALCAPCSKMRNAIRRRRVKVKQEQEKTAAKPNVKKVQGAFGKTLYGMLDQLITENKPKRHSRVGPLSEIRMESAAAGTRGRRSCGPSIKPPRKQRSEQKPRKSNKTAAAASASIGTPISISQLIDSSGGLPVRQAYLPDGTVVNYLTLAGDGGNIVIQNGGEFEFSDGQEYEIIGEADAGGESMLPMQILDPTPAEQTIQIIEVDDQTMAQLASQNININNMNSVFFGDPANIQVTEIDPNDPNTMFKVIHSGQELYLQEDQKVI